MKLSELLACIGVESNDSRKVTGISDNSREIEPGYIFLAIKGSRFDGNNFINDAFENGAIAVISSEMSGENIYKSDDFEKDKATLCYKFYNDPHKKLSLIGVTGTNGKTSVASILYYLLNKLGTRASYLGTLGVVDLDYFLMLDNTTPDSLVLAKQMDAALKRGCKYFIMEVSSHALAMGRVKELEFDAAIFTNISHEHLDYHITMANYVKTKSVLFEMVKDDGFCVINYDDKYHFEIEEVAKGKIINYGLSKNENQISKISRGLDGICFNVGCYEDIKSKLIGVVNAYNISAAFLALIQLGFDEEEIKGALVNMDVVEGRLEKVYSEDYTVIVDYAHTPDALEKVLVEVKPLAFRRLIVIFGCAGNRDKTKRPLMGEIASTYGDVVYITSDNPRFEDPHEIVGDVLKGCRNEKKIVVEVDREIAIKKALSEVEMGDVLMVLGKGHEDYQVIGEEKIYCSDKKMIKKWLRI